LSTGFRLAAVQISAGQAQDALATIDDLHKLPTPAGADPRIDLAESKAKQSLGDFKRAQEAASQAAEKGRLQELACWLPKPGLSRAGIGAPGTLE